MCAGLCVNEQTDGDNCGSCGNICADECNKNCPASAPFFRVESVRRIESVAILPADCGMLPLDVAIAMPYGSHFGGILVRCTRRSLSPLAFGRCGRSGS